jgi:hypothetical protein
MNRFTIALVALALPACTLVVLDADIRSVCSTRHGLAVDGVPAGVPVPPETTVDVDLTLDEVALLDQLDTEIQFAHVRLRPTSGIDDLDFVTSARVSVASADPDAALPTLTIVDCAGDCPRDGLDIVIPAEGDADPMDYVDAGSLALGATIGGDAPAVAWTLDVEVCVSGNARL